MKNAKQLFLFLLSLTFVVSSCSKDDDPAPGMEVKTVQYKIIGSAGVNINTVVYYDGDSPVSKTGNFGNEWTSDENISSKTPIITANAIGPNDDSTLEAQILVDGKVVKRTAASSGKVLQTNISFY